MRTPGSPLELEHRRQLAVQRVREGYTPEEVADFLGVHPASVRRWVAAARRHGVCALSACRPSGRPPKLTPTQEKIVRRWLQHSPSEHGFVGDLWSAPRLAQVIHREFGVRFQPRYLARWLRARGFTLQKPRRLPRERDPQRLADWLAHDWPRIRKRPGDEAQASS
jgi:transposase